MTQADEFLRSWEMYAGYAEPSYPPVE